MSIEPIDLVIFDCDGVLIDSELISAEVLLQEFAQLGANLDFDYFYQNCLGRSFSALTERLTRTTGVNLPANFEERFRTNLLNRFASELKPMPHIQSAIAGLQVPFCVATGSYRNRAVGALKYAGLFDQVGHSLFTGDQVRDGKPAPDLFLHAASTMGVAPKNCLVIEDSDIGIAAAMAANMRVWRFAGGSHLKTRTTLETKTDHIFWDMAELPALMSIQSTLAPYKGSDNSRTSLANSD
jgi:HAD superfamily hydrolase (TIGR01509 family)